MTSFLKVLLGQPDISVCDNKVMGEIVTKMNITLHHENTPI